MDSRIIERDGSHVPDEPVTAPLTPREEQGILEAMAALDAGQGIPFDDAMSFR